MRSKVHADISMMLSFASSDFRESMYKVNPRKLQNASGEYSRD